MKLLKCFEEIAMAFVWVEIGDTDDDEIILINAERFLEFRIWYDGIEIFDINAVRNDSDFFRLYADILHIEIFDGCGVGEIMSDKWFGEPF